MEITWIFKYILYLDVIIITLDMEWNEMILTFFVVKCIFFDPIPISFCRVVCSLYFNVVSIDTWFLNRKSNCESWRTQHIHNHIGTYAHIRTHLQLIMYIYTLCTRILLLLNFFLSFFSFIRWLDDYSLNYTNWS